MATAADTATSATFSTDYASFHEGNVFISESVSATLSHGKGPVKINLHKGGMSVGHEHMTLNLKSADAATGKHLHVSGAKAEIVKNHSSHTDAKIEDGYVGVDYTTSWTVKGAGHHPWSVTLSFSTFVGARPPHHPPQALVAAHPGRQHGGRRRGRRDRRRGRRDHRHRPRVGPGGGRRPLAAPPVISPRRGHRASACREVGRAVPRTPCGSSGHRSTLPPEQRWRGCDGGPP